MSVSKGTERYFAPEVAKIYYKRQDWYPESLKLRPTYVAEKADIYSLGVLLFTMMFGQPPFRENDPKVSPHLLLIGSGLVEYIESFF